MEVQYDTLKEKFETSLKGVLPKFGLMELKPNQKRALLSLISGHDVFVSLPTGYGKSIIYQLAPFVVQEMARLDGVIRNAIVLVFSVSVPDERSS